MQAGTSEGGTESWEDPGSLVSTLDSPGPEFLLSKNTKDVCLSHYFSGLFYMQPIDVPNLICIQ